MRAADAENALQVGLENKSGKVKDQRKTDQKRKQKAERVAEEPSSEDASRPLPVDVTVGSPAFQTMNEPDTVDVGHYIFLRCGHNGHFLDSEKKVFIKHLIRGGIIDEKDSQRYSLMGTGAGEKTSLSGKAKDAATAAIRPYDLESDLESNVTYNYKNH